MFSLLKCSHLQYSTTVSDVTNVSNEEFNPTKLCIGELGIVVDLKRKDDDESTTSNNSNE